ncbi:hypothetical protein LSH36_544g06014 [Paralvinella palmiformis]|uniref:Methyltransferase FkbM domain-containing protein n=1 Tax=Paralvinella palmiformis TaxID=53620 RepID=A0AAD9J706_9ANNE|nr:hypothetical protein LSH36_544g06014 [Paralvinella palmiformis]
MSRKIVICLVLSFVIAVTWLSFNIDKVQQNYKRMPSAVDEIWSVDEIQDFYYDNEQDWLDPGFQRFLRRRWIVGPSKCKAKLRRGDVSQMKQSTFVDGLLNQRRRGFFVESGAAEGVQLSNSLFFETERDWSGLLIEPNPSFFRSLMSKKRNAYLVNACLSTNENVSEVLFKPAGYVGGIADKMEATLLSFVNKAHKHLCDLRLTCFPLVALLDALGVRHVDYLSLDVEGPELDILRTIPFGRVTIDVVTVEYRVSDMKTINEEASERKLLLIREFFAGLRSFREAGILPWDVNQENVVNERRGLDVVFQRIVQ